VPIDPRARAPAAQDLGPLLTGLSPLPQFERSRREATEQQALLRDAQQLAQEQEEREAQLADLGGCLG
jgi:hypothetical protein